MRVFAVLITLIVFGLPESARSQEQSLDGTSGVLQTPGGSASDRDSQSDGREEMWRKTVWWLAPLILLFFLAIFTAQFWIMYVSGEYWTDQHFKAFTLTLIIAAGLFLIVVGWNDQQLAPMMGLLGTIAGYILGDANRNRIDTAIAREQQIAGRDPPIQ